VGGKVPTQQHNYRGKTGFTGRLPGMILTDPVALKTIDPCELMFFQMEQFYKIVSSLFVNDNVWKPLLDNWYYERGPKSGVDFLGNTPQNQAIVDNVGFRRLLACWFVAKHGNNVPESPTDAWIIGDGGFHWGFRWNQSESAGGPAAYDAATNFLGSYDVEITMLNDHCPFCDVSITVKNTTSWDSATGIPKSVSTKLLNEYLGFPALNALFNLPVNEAGRMSMFPSHLMNQGPCSGKFPSRGGDYTQKYIFALYKIPCSGDPKTCILP
jgi:hypothetical protein